MASCAGLCTGPRQSLQDKVGRDQVGGKKQAWQERVHLPQLCAGPCGPDPRLKSGAGACL